MLSITLAEAKDESAVKQVKRRACLVGTSMSMQTATNTSIDQLQGCDPDLSANTTDGVSDSPRRCTPSHKNILDIYEAHGRASADVIVLEGAIINGSIQCRNILLGGEIEGDVHATGLATIQRTAQFDGTLTANRVHFEDGAGFNGTLSLGNTNTDTKTKNNTNSNNDMQSNVIKTAHTDHGRSVNNKTQSNDTKTISKSPQSETRIFPPEPKQTPEEHKLRQRLSTLRNNTSTNSARRVDVIQSLAAK